MPVVKFNKAEIDDFINKYKDHLFSPTNEYMSHFLKFKNGSVSIYKSGKVVFQGSDLSMFKDYIKDDSLLKDQSSFNKTINIDDYPYDKYDTIGADEVGTGDSFGPIVCASLFLKSTDVCALRKMGVTDSKKIDDKSILKIGKYLIGNYPYSVSIIRNEVYNDNIDKYNLNEMKSFLHNKNFKVLSEKVNAKYLLLDEFCSKENYYNYLKDKALGGITFETKGESKSTAVAGASIIARYYLIKEFENLRIKYGYNFELGSGIKAQKIIDQIKADGKTEIFYHTAKTNFKNFK